MLPLFYVSFISTFSLLLLPQFYVEICAYNAISTDIVSLNIILEYYFNRVESLLREKQSSQMEILQILISTDHNEIDFILIIPDFESKNKNYYQNNY